MNEDNEYDENVDCKLCVHSRISYTRIIGATIPEYYCGLTGSDSFCYGECYEED